jgi:hypothetical protein
LPIAANGPADPPAAHNARYLPPNLPLEHRPPRHQIELERVLDHCELSIADLNRPAADPLHVVADLVLTEGSPTA